MASLQELGLGKQIYPYTGYNSVDWVLNHHMTPLFTIFVATAIFRYLYTAGWIFPLDESERLKKSNETSTEKTDATHQEKITSSKSGTKKKKKKDEFILGVVCHGSNDSDRLEKQRTTIATAKKVKGVRVVMDVDPTSDDVHAIYVSLDDPRERCEIIKRALKAKKHVLVDFPVARRENVELLRVMAKNHGVLLVQLVTSRYVASWERLFSSVHAEAGVVSEVHMEYLTGPMPRCVESSWNCCCRCSWIDLCRGRGSRSRRSRASAAPSLADATAEGMSLLHELLSDIARDHQPLIVTENKSERENTVDVAGWYKSKSTTTKIGETTEESKTKWTYQCSTSSWSLMFPRAAVRVIGSESDVVYNWYDSIDGNQSVQVTSRHGFSHTDRVADLYDAWTMSIVSFVRAIRHGDSIKDMLKSTEAALECTAGLKLKGD